MACRIAIRFAIRGDLRFLSHQDSMRLFERAAVRAQLPLRWSGGFNPRPRLSLPLPRPVGVAGEDELLVLELEERGDATGVDGRQASGEVSARDQQRPSHDSQCPPAELCCLLARLAPQLPGDVRLLEARPVRSVPQAELAVYRLIVPDADGEAISRRVAGVLSADTCVVMRQTDAEGGGRTVDIRPYVAELWWAGEKGELNWSFRVTPEGSARPGELLALLGLDPAEHLHRVVRVRVKWKE